MTWRVLWIQSALDDLTALWMNADSDARTAINQAALRIDKELARDPHKESESRDEGEWVFFAEPLGVLLEIDEAKRIVWVISAWRYR